jgi:hypothetical protein
MSAQDSLRLMRVEGLFCFTPKKRPSPKARPWLGVYSRSRHSASSLCRIAISPFNMQRSNRRFSSSSRSVGAVNFNMRCPSLGIWASFDRFTVLRTWLDRISGLSSEMRQHFRVAKTRRVGLTAWRQDPIMMCVCAAPPVGGREGVVRVSFLFVVLGFAPAVCGAQL